MRLHLNCSDGNEYIYEFHEFYDDEEKNIHEKMYKTYPFFVKFETDGFINQKIFIIESKFFKTDYEYRFHTANIVRYWIEVI